jgi:hypothetical protein
LPPELFDTHLFPPVPTLLRSVNSKAIAQSFGSRWPKDLATLRFCVATTERWRQSRSLRAMILAPGALRESRQWPGPLPAEGCNGWSRMRTLQCFPASRVPTLERPQPPEGQSGGRPGPTRGRGECDRRRAHSTPVQEMRRWLRLLGSGGKLDARQHG